VAVHLFVVMTTILSVVGVTALLLMRLDVIQGGRGFSGDVIQPVIVSRRRRRRRRRRLRLICNCGIGNHKNSEALTELSVRQD